MTIKPGPDDTEPRDAHLLAALRHAPDRDATPSAALSARILERARAAATASAPPQADRHAAWRRALLLWREPQRAAAFATLAFALLLGLLWGSQEPPLSTPLPPAPEPAADVREAAATAPAPGPPVPAAAVERAPAATMADKAQPAARTRPATSPRIDAAPTPAPSPPAAVSPAPVEPAQSRGEAAAGATAPRSAEPATATATANGQASADAMLERRRDAPTALGKLAAAPSGQPAFARLDALVAGDGATLSWQRGADSWAHGAAQRRWWALLRQATRGIWSRDPAAESAPATAWLALLESGRPALTLWQTEGSIRLRDADGSLWRATPDAAQLQALRQAGEGW